MAFSNPIVAGRKLIIEGIESTDFEPGVTGWSIERDGNAQFNNLAISGNIGAGTVNADDVIIGGDSFVSDIQPTLATCLGSYEITTQPADITSPQERAVMAISFDVISGYTYQITGSAVRIRQPAVTPVSDGGIRMRFTTNGTAPDLSSTIFYEAVGNDLDNIGASLPINKLYKPNFSGTVRILFSFFSVANTIRMEVNSTYPCQLYVNQLGPMDDFGVASSLFSGGGGTNPDPVTTTTKTYNAVWAGTYRANLQPSTASDSYIWQGYGDSFNGNQRGLIGFPYATIQSDLSGATIVYCNFKFKVQHTWFNAGSNARLGTHIYTTEPGSWNGANVNEGLVTSGNVVSGGTYQVPMGVTVGNAFKAGTARGIALGPWTSNSNTGYMNIYNQAALMQLIIQYRK